MTEQVRPRRRKPRRNKWIIPVIICMLLLCIATMVLGFLLPYQRARSAMPANGEFVIRQQEDGKLMLTWPAADQADYYCVEILLPAATEEDTPEVVYKDFFYTGTSCTLPQLPDNMKLTLRVSPVIVYKTLFEEKIRISETPIEVTTTFNIPAITDLTWEVDPDSDIVSIHYGMQPGDHCQVYHEEADGTLTKLRNVQDTALQFTFGEEGDFPAVGYGESCRLVFDAYREMPGLRFYGATSGELAVVRDDLLGRNLELECVDMGHNVFSLSWNETKGEHYEVQMLDEYSMQWTTVHEVAGDGSRTYTTPHLPIYEEYGYRVVAVGGQTMEDSEFAAISQEVTVTTKESPIFTTIWPTKRLQAYSDSQKSNSVGKVEIGKAYCVIDEKDGMFGIRLDGQTAYIDSNYCMINLTEYLGDTCSYEITNSYSSIYMVHEFEIPNVTDVITAGYEKVRLSDGSFLVPLLYPCAQKLAVAAQTAISEGYRLKIYDTFRPYKATREIYDLTSEILDEELPEEPFTDVAKSSLDLPEPEIVMPAEGEEVPEGEQKAILTYRMVMCGSGYSLGAFLAKSGSLHNLGIAIDLTLESLQDGEELKMQTSMHDLSRYSVLNRNNSSANKLAKIMKSAGFGDLVSEWWHFQDNEARSRLGPPTVSDGVSANCWMADDRGWRYRNSKGIYYAGETVTIEGAVYTFDEAGYLTIG